MNLLTAALILVAASALAAAFDPAPTITACALMVTAIASLTAAIASIRGNRKVVAVAAVVEEVKEDVKHVKDDVQTINSMTVGQRSDKAELQEIEAKPEGDRTPLEREHVEAMKDVEL